MIAKLGPGNILHRHGLYILHHALKNSWFCQVREITILYSLQDPMVTLTSPPSSKSLWKKSVKSAVCQYWHRELAAKAASLPSLCHLRAPFLPPPWPASAVVDLRLLRLRQPHRHRPGQDAEWPLPEPLAAAPLGTWRVRSLPPPLLLIPTGRPGAPPHSRLPRPGPCPGPHPAALHLLPLH